MRHSSTQIPDGSHVLGFLSISLRGAKVFYAGAGYPGSFEHEER